MIMRPLNIQKWIDENRFLLKPPIGNKNIYSKAGNYIVMIVGGPNSRKDYHYNETEEIFYQLEGDIEVMIQENGKAVKIPIKEGEMYLLPAKIPHLPIRPANTVGLVIELKRQPNHKDGLMWFCEHCNNKLYDTYFPLKDIENDFQHFFRLFFNSEKLRTCNDCGKIMEKDPRFTI